MQSNYFTTWVHDLEFISLDGLPVNSYPGGDLFDLNNSKLNYKAYNFVYEGLAH